MSYTTPGSGGHESESHSQGESTRQLNSLLRGEISAEETYRNAIDRMENADASTIGMLQEIQEEHGRAADTIRNRIQELGAEPSESSGAWGMWAKMTQGISGLFAGETGSLKALKEGEEHGLKDYQDGLNSLDVSSAELVQNQLIPAQQRHINLLDQLINSAGQA